MVGFERIAEVSSVLVEREGFADSGRSSVIINLSNGLLVPEWC